MPCPTLYPSHAQDKHVLPIIIGSWYQFLQSQDRIHRIGLAAGQITTMEILACPGTIDVSVENRLSSKIRTMREVLNDDSVGFDVYWAETEDEDFDFEDAADLLRLLQSE